MELNCLLYCSVPLVRLLGDGVSCYSSALLICQIYAFYCSPFQLMLLFNMFACWLRFLLQGIFLSCVYLICKMGCIMMNNFVIRFE